MKRHRGFTLVETMATVAIVGVLAALATTSVRRYINVAKTSEGKNGIGAIARNAVAAFERERTIHQLLGDATISSKVSHRLCGAASPVPDTIAKVKATKYQPNSKTGSDYETGDDLTGWRCLRFSYSQPTYFMYGYATAGSGFAMPNNPAANGADFEASATEDFNGDGVSNGYALTGKLNAAGDAIKTSTHIYVQDNVGACALAPGPRGTSAAGLVGAVGAIAMLRRRRRA